MVEPAREPCPDYESMEDGDLKLVLRRYGVRSGRRGWMVSQAKKLWNATHATAATSSGRDVGGASGADDGGRARAASPTTPARIQSQRLSLLPKNLFEDVEEASSTQQQRATMSKQQKEAEQVARVTKWIRENDSLYRNVLEYRPIDVMWLQSQISSVLDIRWGRERLSSYLDGQGIVFDGLPKGDWSHWKGVDEDGRGG